MQMLQFQRRDKQTNERRIRVGENISENALCLRLEGALRFDISRSVKENDLYHLSQCSYCLPSTIFCHGMLN